VTEIHNIWGINFFLSDLDDYSSYLEKILAEKVKIILNGINPYSLSIIKKNPVMLDALRISTIAHVDGILLKYSLQLLGYEVLERLDTPSVFFKLMEICVQKKLRIFLLGSKAEDIPKIKDNLSRTFPGIIIAGSYHGYFKKEDEDLIVRKINKCKSDVLILGMPSSKKEVFIYDQYDKMNFKISLGVGGVFDVLAGKKKASTFDHQEIEY
jgi:N-acetylglucosaminyldiphosphoundecaprenol N-acetyl-beta-D-mannosaminyltransferase